MTAARLADGAWSVPPPRLRDNVLAAIAHDPADRSGAGGAESARAGRLVAGSALVAAAAAVVAAATARHGRLRGPGSARTP